MPFSCIIHPIKTILTYYLGSFCFCFFWGELEWDFRGSWLCYQHAFGNMCWIQLYTNNTFTPQLQSLPSIIILTCYLAAILFFSGKELQLGFRGLLVCYQTCFGGNMLKNSALYYFFYLHVLIWLYYIICPCLPERKASFSNSVDKMWKYKELATP